ncbi:hypothetical protein GCM10023205_03880 [Yinghuangia aomiensis]|uniref:N-acetyltransferase domain-containing protein n=1 Tax=Yinghuangia aomiensis TaxID=676205 RepID=A0ABP9GLT8_9ACTN
MTAPAACTVEGMRPEHAGQVLAIYQVGIDTGHATFETAAPAWGHFDTSRLPGHRFVALDEGDGVLRWVAVSDHCVYTGVVEHSVYVHPNAQGRGIGRILLEAPIPSTEAAGAWTVQSGVFPREHRQPLPAPQRGLPHRRGARTRRPAPRQLARRRPDRAPQSDLVSARALRHLVLAAPRGQSSAHRFSNIHADARSSTTVPLRSYVHTMHRPRPMPTP